MRPSHYVPGMFGALLSIGLLVLLALAIAALVWWLLKRRKGTGAGFVPGPPWPPGSDPLPQPGQRPVPQPANAMQILDERLARGDVDVDDYLTRRAALLGDRPPNGTVFEQDRPAPTTDSPPDQSA